MDVQSAAIPPTPIERLQEILGHEVALTDDVTFLYSWDHGLERVRLTQKNGGGLEYNGMYHGRNGMCEGNPCIRCGTVWHE